MLKELTEPLSGETVALRDEMASLLSLESKAPRGRDTTAYREDMSALAD
jgi:hypothetical protein